MEADLISQIKDLAPASIAVFSTAWILWQVIKGQMRQTQKDKEWFVKYVEENNHQKSDMIREHTATLVEVRNSLEGHNKILEKLSDKIK